jgi:hypothetical protein
VVTNTIVTGESPEWVMVENGDIMVTGAGAACIMAVVTVAAVAVTLEVAFITGLTLSHSDIGASSVKRRSLPSLKNT